MRRGIVGLSGLRLLDTMSEDVFVKSYCAAVSPTLMDRSVTICTVYQFGFDSSKPSELNDVN